MSHPRLSLLDARNPRVEPIWRSLEAQSALPYFLSWGWTENWLACLPRDAAPSLAVIEDEDGPLAAFFTGRRWLLRATGPSRTRFLNATGVPRYDELCIEHNAVATSPRLSISLDRFLGLLPDDWDELVLPGLAADAFPGRVLASSLPHHQLVVEREVSSPYVDLAKVRAAGDYIDVLGSNTRAQMRRALRGYGSLDVEISTDAQHALDIFGELVQLHGEAWRRRGQAGAFADPWFCSFHRRLVLARHAHGEIQLVRVKSAGATVGCLYNLISNGRVHFYQSGLATTDDAHKKPGYVCHCQAIRHAAAAGHGIYDFLGGDARYKQSLATDASHLVWARVRRPLARFALEDGLRGLKRTLMTKAVPQS